MISVEKYLTHRRGFESVGWAMFLSVNLAANTFVSWNDSQEVARPYQLWEIFTWEASSSIVIAGLLGFILLIDRLAPINRRTWRRSVPIHLAATVVFSLVHVSLMVAIRKFVYWLKGSFYDFGAVGSELLYEYAKDIRTYFILLSIIYLYRLTLRRWQGEAQLMEETDGPDETETQVPADRFLVKKLGNEHLVKVADIDWIEAAGNYVTLHCGKRLYPLRDTMTNISDRLERQGFARIHRSTIVNLDRVREIRPTEAGEAEVVLSSDKVLSASRRYRSELKQRLA